MRFLYKNGFLFLVVSLFLFPAASQAALRVVTTTSDLGAIASEVAGGDAEVESIAKGTQDPHFIEAKPSYMSKVSRADLLVAVGLGLEEGWLPSLIRGARNPKVNRGDQGYLEVGPSVDPIEMPTGKVTRAEGDVHPDGNPHVTLDPVRAGKIAKLVAERLAALDAAHAAGYRSRAEALDSRLLAKTKDWRNRVEKSGVKKVITYHKTLSYFFDRFGINNAAILEPKPGIPPTSGHIIEVVKLMKDQGVKLVLVENFFDDSVTKKILGEVPGSRSHTVPVAVGGAEFVKTIDEVYETLVKAVEGK